MGWPTRRCTAPGCGWCRGNLITARPLGVRRGGLRLHWRGAAHRRPRHPPVAGAGRHRPTVAARLFADREIFNLRAEEVATAAAMALRADKLLVLGEGPNSATPLVKRSASSASVTPTGCWSSTHPARRLQPPPAPGIARRTGRVRRIHLLSRQVDGALLLELFTRDGWAP